MTEISLQPASMLDLIAKAATSGASDQPGCTPVDAEIHPVVSHCFKNLTPVGPVHPGNKQWGDAPYSAPEGVAGEVFALLKDATDYPMVPQVQAGKRRFFVAVRQLVDAIADAYRCDQCSGNERAELHQQAADSIEAIKCFVLLARQVGLGIGWHRCWQEWGLA